MSKTDAPPVMARKERKANADMRRLQLLNATLRSIAANGLTKTTLATVAKEAGLSQGVAVFYFHTKTGLLTEALREHYRRYEHNWTSHLSKANAAPLSQLMAMIKADFEPEVCNPEALSIWFAFWGEQNFTPQYAEISAQFDRNRATALQQICRKLMVGSPAGKADEMGAWIDTLTDGFWQKLHLFPEEFSREDALSATLSLVAQLLPEHVIG